MMETLDHMAALIEQMLFLARAEDPATLIDLSEIEIGAFLGSVKDAFEPLAEEANVTLKVQAPADLVLVGDRTLLRRALHNLLANSVRHSASGQTVILQGRLEEEASILEVIDQGEGISETHLEKLGQRFLRPDPSRSRSTGGAGLGLAIVQSIARLHGGSLNISSNSGTGTTVQLRFPKASH
jgi:two-component system heavy metal sensor histidine kinase CusS